ncbi:hypothetical protein D9M69_596680 [compost metagenome]
MSEGASILFGVGLIGLAGLVTYAACKILDICAEKLSAEVDDDDDDTPPGVPA